MTPHIESNPNDIANIVIMPGDPKRAKYIADNYLTNVRQISLAKNAYQKLIDVENMNDYISK